MSAIKVKLVARASCHPAIGTVIFVHGITGESGATFSNEAYNFAWMKELATDYSSWDILAVDYGSSFWSRVRGPMVIDEGPTIPTLALELAHELKERNIETDRVIFVCHSMGGLVVKNLFEAVPCEVTGSLLEKVSGIMFLGTPHAGAELARLLKRYSGTFSSRLVSDLHNTDYLKRLTDNFAEVCVKWGIYVVNFVEQVPLVFTLRVVQTQEGMLSWLAQSRNIELNLTHVEISKPENRKALQYRELKRLMDRVHVANAGWINIFPHFLDHHFLRSADYENAFRRPRIEYMAEIAFRLCLMIGDNIFVHAGFYYESSLARRIIDKYEPYFLGKISLFANASDMESYAMTSQGRFKAGDTHHNAYKFEPEFAKLDFIPTAESSTEVIKRAWLSVDPEVFRSGGELVREVTDPGQFQEEWSNVPEKLGNLAMIANYIAPLLTRLPAPILNRRVQEFTRTKYYEGILSRLNCKVLEGIPFFPRLVPSPTRSDCIQMREIDLLDRLAASVARNTGADSLQKLLTFLDGNQGRDFCDAARSKILNVL